MTIMIATTIKIFMATTTAMVTVRILMSQINGDKNDDGDEDEEDDEVEDNQDYDHYDNDDGDKDDYYYEYDNYCDNKDYNNKKGRDLWQ